MILRDGKPNRIKIKRTIIDLKSKQNLISKKIDEKIVYINPSFYYGKARGYEVEFYKDIQDYHKQGIRGLILDLRSGIAVKTAQYIAGGFLNKDTVIGYEKKRNGLVPLMPEQKKEAFSDFKLVVLTDEETTFGSELLAEALRGYLNAIIIGRSTSKDGTLREVYRIKTENYTDFFINYISGELLTHKNPIKDVGIEPDIIVEETLGTSEHDQILERAIDYLKKSF